MADVEKVLLEKSHVEELLPEHQLLYPFEDNPSLFRIAGTKTEMFV